MSVSLFVCLESRLPEAGYFHAISESSKLAVNFLQLSEQEEGEDRTASILRQMEKINNVQPEVILLYTNKEDIELMLQQVIIIP